MPIIAMFYGIIIRMFYRDNKFHHLPHVHVQYQEETAVFNIETAEILEGSLPSRKVRLVQAWIEIHQEELMADWQLAVNGEEIFKIDPLH